MSLEEDTWLLLHEDLELQASEAKSEDTIMDALRHKVSELLQKDAGYFFQLMYRLDIPETEITAALGEPVHTVDRLSAVIYRRQLEKARSRAKFKKQDNAKDEDLDW